jgi:hypothetical protein
MRVSYRLLVWERQDVGRSTCERHVFFFSTKSWVHVIYLGDILSVFQQSMATVDRAPVDPAVACLSCQTQDLADFLSLVVTGHPGVHGNFSLGTNLDLLGNIGLLSGLLAGIFGHQKLQVHG